MKKHLLSVLVLSTLTANSGLAAVFLNLSERPGGGVNIVASGSIDVTGFTHVFDHGAQFINTYSISATNVTINGSNGGLEMWRSTGATYAMPTIAASLLTFTSYGTFGHGLQVDNLGRVGVYGAVGFADDNLPPPGQTVFHFDFEGYNATYDVSRFIDGAVIWDSNGAAAGGETVTLRVVPEPASFALLGLAASLSLTRRRRAH